MHSRIFQVSNESIAEEDFIRESRYYEETRFDYVETSKIAEDLKWLSSVEEGRVVHVGQTFDYHF